jgi:hypothetical protein
VSGPGTPPAQPAQPNPPNAQPGSWHRGARVVPRAQHVPRQPQRPLHFRGQNTTERIVWIRRQSRLYLLATGAPLLFGLFGLFLLHTWLGDAAGGPHLVLLVVGGLLIVLTIRWIFVDFWNWFFLHLVLTNERVVKSKGYFHRIVEQIPLKNIAQVLVERPNPLMMLFKLGDVEVRPIGTPIIMSGLAQPREAADSILAMQEDPNYALPPQATPAAPDLQGVQNKKLQATLDTLAQPAPMPGQPVISARSFATFLERRIPIRFFEGEQVVEVVYRHWFILLRDESLAIVIFFGGVITGSLLLRSEVHSALPVLLILIGVLAGGGLGALIYLNWADDVFVLTTHRVIDVDRLVFILAEYSNDAPYARIQEVNVNRTLLGKLLGYGNIRVETSGRKRALQMQHIPHAFAVMDRIFAQINLLRERELVAAVNKQKQENYRWFAATLSELVTKVPDVRGLALLDAAGQLRRAGLKLVVLAERQVPGVASGLVVEQEPSPDTAALAEGEVRVVLSSQGVGTTA